MTLEEAQLTTEAQRAQRAEGVSWGELLELMRFEVERMGFRPQSRRVLDWVLRGSFGCGLREVHVWGLDWFVERSGLDVANVSRELNWLVEHGVLYCRDLGAGPEGQRKRGYGFELDADLWDVNGRLSRERALVLWRSARVARGAGVQVELPPADLPGALRLVMEELGASRAGHISDVLRNGLAESSSPLADGSRREKSESGERVAVRDGTKQPFSSKNKSDGTDRWDRANNGVVDSTIVESTNGANREEKRGFVDSTNGSYLTSELLTGLTGPVQGSKASELVTGRGARSAPKPGIDLKAEREFLEALSCLFSPEVYEEWAKWWRVVFRDCPGACWAALRDVESRLKEGFPVRHPGAYMRDLFLRFRKGRKGFVPREELNAKAAAKEAR